MAIPKATHAIVEVATSAAIKTVLQVATPSTTDIRIHGWGIGFDGIDPIAAPGVVTLVDTDVAASVTTLTPELWESPLAPASLCVGGAALTGYNASAEGTIAASIIRDGQEVHPQSGYGVWFPEGRRPAVNPSRFLRIRTLFAVTINCVPWIVWEEPA
jgi:hypothetical protein